MKMVGLLFIWLMAFQSFGQEVVIGYSDLASPPYIVGGSGSVNSKSPGVTVELIRLVSNQVGVDVVFKRAPWSRVLKMAKHNQVDAVFHASFKEARTLFLEYPMNQGEVDKSKYLKRQRYFLYKLKNAHIYSDNGVIFSITGKVGVTTHYAILSDLAKQGLNIKETINAYKGLELLSKGRIEGWVGLESITDGVLKSHEKFGTITKEPWALSDDYSYLAFSKVFYQQHPDLAHSLWQQIESTTASAVYQKLFEKYQ